MIPPGGIGGGRKGAEKDWGDGDWDVPVAEPPKALEETEETVNEKFKVEMQRLHMSEENQELLKAALLEVRGELRLRKEKSYKDQGRRLDHGYWLKDNQLLVRGVQDFSEERLVHPSGWLLIKIFIIIYASSPRPGGRVRRDSLILGLFSPSQHWLPQVTLSHCLGPN